VKFPRLVCVSPLLRANGARVLRLLFLLWCALRLSAAEAQESAAKMRVGLGRFASAPELVLRAEPGARLLDGEGHECAAGGGPFVLRRTGGDVTARDAQGRLLGTAGSGTYWRLQSDEGATVLTISTPKGAKHRYRGELEVGTEKGRLRIVNEVSLEDYVRGVIGPEMGSRAPLEALKAQAVASRTFALSSLGRWTSDGYDLRDSTDSQVYSGVEAERPECDRAVRETSGLILSVGGHAIAAYFCADCGGFTAPGDTPEECPHAVSDADAHGAPDKPLPPTWSLTFTSAKLSGLFARSGPPGMVLALVAVTETDVSGRARKLRLTWIPASSTRKLGKTTPPTPQGTDAGPPLETAFPTESRKREKPVKQGTSPEEPLPPGAVTRDLSTATLRSLLGANTLRSTLFTVRRNAEGTFVFEGRGWGHGRGLCQVGAMALAIAPHSLDFRAILHRYYAGATLAPLSRTEENEEGGTGLPATAPPANAPSTAAPPVNALPATAPVTAAFPAVSQGKM
jgi:stage II sporulation protein D